MMYYWELKEAVEELRRRQEDSRILQEERRILGDDCPIPVGPYGFLTRHIASAREEDVQFNRRCQEIGLEPVWLEYSKDIFVTRNPSKVRLLRLQILIGYGKKGGPHLWRYDLIDRRNLDRVNGVPMDLIETKWGESLVRFHHRTRKMVGLPGRVINISVWLKSIGRAKEYYKYFFAALVRRGILFESFQSAGFKDLDAFNQAVVIPAWEWTVAEFNGCAPLIVRHPVVSSPEEEERVLNWYPKEVAEAIPPEYR